MNDDIELKDDFLSRELIERITACKHPSKQCEQLRLNNTHYIVDRNGLPNVTWYAINNPLNLRFNNTLAHNDEPDFKAMGL